MLNAQIPKELAYLGARDLLRVGKDNDGGYLISRSDMMESNLLISIGVSNDWSFEKEFRKLNKVEVIAYDASISSLFFLKKLLSSALRFHNPAQFFAEAINLFDYWDFFNGRSAKHIERFVGFDSIGGAPFDSYVTLQSVFDAQKSKRIFLKVDIEGSEYRILETIVKNQHRLSGLVVEFHDCDLHIEKISDFLKKMELRVVHIHANNFAPVSSINLLPLVMELTFSRFASELISPIFPHAYDMPNNAMCPEIKLQIADDFIWHQVVGD